jgi:hypothetical protein
MRYRRSRLGAAVLGGLALSVAGLVDPASATPIDRGTFHDEGSFVVEDTCDVPGFTSRVDYVVDGRFMLYSRGADRLPYFNENRTQSFVFTNLTTGEFVTIKGRENGNDVQATEEGGILTYVTVHTGTSVMYDMDGKAIARDTGQTRLELHYDDGGTPTDPTDDAFLDAITLTETGLASINYCAETVHAIG